MTTSFPGSFPWLGGGTPQSQGKDPGNEVVKMSVDEIDTILLLRTQSLTDSDETQSRGGQTTPQMFHEDYICFFHIFLNQIWQMSFDCVPVHFNLEFVTKCQIMTS